MVESRELGTVVDPLGQRAMVEFGTQRLEAETKDPSAMTQMESGRPTANPAHR